MRRYDKSDPDFISWLTGRAEQAHAKSSFLAHNPDVGPWITPDLINNYGAAPPPRKAPCYRYHIKLDDFEFDGGLDVSDANVGDIAFYIIQPFWPKTLKEYITSYRTVGAVFGMSLVEINPDDGAVRVYN